MPAFTHLCKNVHISVAHNTVTLYDPLAPNHPQFWTVDLYDPDDQNDPFAKQISTVKPVNRDHFDHDFFHDDRFDREKVHLHMKFTKNIDEVNFAIFLTILIEKAVINEEEKENCLMAFRQASHDTMSMFYDELKVIELKMEDLSRKAEANPKYHNAASEARKLYNTLKDESNAYFKKRTAEAYNQFRINCKNAIKEAEKELKIHRGWKEVCFNLGSATLGLGVFYLAALGNNYYRSHGERFFLHCETDSEKKLKHFEKALTSILRI